MPNRGHGRSDDRRRQPRVSCRLHGRITHGREKIRARIVDISEGGLCLLLPVWVNPKQPLAIAIEVPGRETATVHVEIWHIRREKSRSSKSKVWIAGAVLRDADTAYAQLLTAAGLATTRPGPSSSDAKPATESTSTASPGAVSGTPPKAAPEKRPDSATTPVAMQPGSSSSTKTSPQRTSAVAAPAAAASGTAPTSAVDVLDELEPRVFRLRCKAKGSPRTRVLSLAAESVEQAHKLAAEDLGAEWDILEVLEA